MCSCNSISLQIPRSYISSNKEVTLQLYQRRRRPPCSAATRSSVVVLHNYIEPLAICTYNGYCQKHSPFIHTHNLQLAPRLAGPFEPQLLLRIAEPGCRISGDQKDQWKKRSERRGVYRSYLTTEVVDSWSRGGREAEKQIFDDGSLSMKRVL